ncbi:hypothetical protein FACS1894159_08580 [Bacteroidia bacterium]|nr:hypothetical protein FACS1894159_08580 [Bacteroidia bacterium]
MVLVLASLAAGAQQIGYSLEKVAMGTNPAGIGFSFWCNNKFSEKMMLDFGRRPYERMGFYSWNAVETSPGEYDTKKIVESIRQVHSLGSTCIISLNNISGPWFLPSFKSQIPSFYAQNIDDKKTREAGRKYIYAVVQQLLKQTGNLDVCFDYEMMWHCRPDTPEKQQMLSAWYIDAVASARKAAADLGMSDALKIMPIVNGSIDDSTISKLLGSKQKNHRPAKWLLDMVAVSDYLAIDSYDFDINDPINPAKTLSTLGFWTANYSMGKPVLITEFGYSTGNTHFPAYKTTYHAMGTEEQQRDFYGALLPMLVRENVPGGKLGGQVRCFSFWMYSDSKAKQKNQEREHYFGIVRMDGSHKPSFDVIKTAIERIESDPATAPSIEKSRTKIAASSLAGGIASRYVSGTEFDCFCLTPLKKGLEATIEVTLGQKGTLLLFAAGRWQQSLEAKQLHSLRITLDGAPVKIYLTGGVFPVEQTLKNVVLKTL